MIWDIYSIGDATYLASILNAVAMLSGTQDMRTLAGVGFLLGVILVAFQGALQGAHGIKFQNVLIAWVIYAGLFGTTAKVAIEDAYTGAVRVVDHVPFGPAFVGSTMSLVGYKLTRLFEQTFTTPAMTSNGFADPLQTLATVRKALMSRATLAKANSPVPGADAEKTYTNFFDECLLRDVDAGGRTIDAVMSAQDWFAFAVDADMWTTEIWTGGVARTVSCRQAGQEIAAFTGNLFLPALHKTLQTALRLQAPGDVPGRVQTALDTLSGQGQDAQNYMVMAALLPFLEQGMVQTHQNLHEFTEATMVQQALEQRNAQWAAENTLFTRIVRPMMTFFEGFIFAITPLMGFAIALGPTGILMVGKWLLFGLWIQLWMPVLAVINLYINLAAERDLAAIAAVEEVALSSFYGIMKADVLIQDYLATGGMLAASTPAISLMLIYGSAITATHLAGRLQGGDHIDEKQMSPDVLKTAPAGTITSQTTREPFTGSVTTGAEGLLGAIQVGRALSSSVASASTVQSQAAESFKNSLGRSAASSAAHEGQSFADHALSHSWSSSTSQTDQYINAQAEGIARTFGLQGGQTEQIAAALSAGIGAGGSEKGGRGVIGGMVHAMTGLEGKAEGNLKSSYADETATKAALTDEIARRATLTTSQSAELAQRTASDAREGHHSVFTTGLSTADQSQLARDSSELVSATQNLQRTETEAASVGAQTSLPVVKLAHLVAADPKAMARLVGAVARHNLAGDVGGLAGQDIYRKGLASPDERYAAAALRTLFGMKETASPRGESQRALMREAGLRAVRELAGGPDLSGISPSRNAGIAQDTPQAGAARRAWEGAGIQDPSGSTAALPAEAGAAHIATRSMLAGGREAVQADHDGKHDAVKDGWTRGQGEIRARQHAEVGRQIKQADVMPRSLARVTAEEAGGLLTDLGNLVKPKQNFGSAIWDSSARFIESIQQNGDIGKAIEAAGNGWSDARAALIGAQVDEMKGRYHLTNAQVAMYEATLGTMLPRTRETVSLDSDELANARKVLREEEGPIGDHIANLLINNAATLQDSHLSTIGHWNDTKPPPRVEVGPVETDASSQGRPAGARTGFRRGGESQYGPMIVDAAQRHGVDPAFAMAIARTESQFNPNALSPKKAGGLMQLMPDTAARFKVADRMDPQQNVDGGMRYLRWLGDRFNGDPTLVAAAYNAGEGAVQKYQNQVPPYPETQHYVKEVAKHRADFAHRLV